MSFPNVICFNGHAWYGSYFKQIARRRQLVNLIFLDDFLWYRSVWIIDCSRRTDFSQSSNALRIWLLQGKNERRQRLSERSNPFQMFFPSYKMGNIDVNDILRKFLPNKIDALKKKYPVLYFPLVQYHHIKLWIKFHWLNYVAVPEHTYNNLTYFIHHIGNSHHN